MLVTAGGRSRPLAESKTAPRAERRARAARPAVARIPVAPESQKVGARPAATATQKAGAQPRRELEPRASRAAAEAPTIVQRQAIVRGGKSFSSLVATRW